MSRSLLPLAQKVIFRYLSLVEQETFRNPFQKQVEAYSKLPDLTLTMTEEELLADWDAKQKQRGKSGSPLHVPSETFVSRVTGRSIQL